MTILNNYLKVLENDLLFEVRHGQLLPKQQSQKAVYFLTLFLFKQLLREKKKQGIFNL